MANTGTTPERLPFRLELFSRGGDPRSPTERVFELPCPGLPADARVFGVIKSGSSDATSTLASLIRNAIISAQTLTRRTLNSGLDGRFEAMLLAVNRGYAELSASGTLPVSPLPDALMGMIVENEVFLTGRGAVEAHVFRRGGAEEPRDLFADGDNHGEGRALFRTILSGTLRQDDVVLVTLTELFDYLSLAHLRRVLSENPAREARTRVLELLGDVPTSVSLSGIIIGTPTPSGKEAKAFKPWQKPPAAAAVQPGEARAELKSVSRAKKVGGVIASGMTMGTKAGGKVLVRGGSAIGSALAATGLGFWKILTDRSRRGDAFRRLKDLPDSLVGRWNAMPMKSRIVLIALIVLALLFGESLRIMARGKAAEDKVKAYNEQVASIQAKRDAAEASMIYSDEDKAWSELADAETEAKALPQADEAQKKTVSDLLAQIEADRDKLRHVVKLDDLPALGSVPDDAGSAVSVIAGKSLVTIVGDKGGTVNWDIGKKSMSPAVAAFLTDPNIRSALPGAKGPIYVTWNATLDRSGTSTIKYPITLPGGATATAVDLWNSRLYALVSGANQVYKGAQSDSGWKLDTAALKSNLPDGMADLSIDGSVWVAGGSTVKRYLSGEEQPFEMKRLDPAPQDISRIWTTASGDLLFLYDKSLKRLYAVSKSTGDLKAQYVGGPIDDLRDLSADEKTGVLWLVTSRSLYLEELK